MARILNHEGSYQRDLADAWVTTNCGTILRGFADGLGENIHQLIHKQGKGPNNKPGRLSLYISETERARLWP
ncbi:hypothetical protein [Primorskyibacter sp. S87]|uniref:hypothetical protein n=1 Tax=Primorskyibacter sp. S87 TaxID=3415126 RepID=UPI003C7A25D1